MTILIDLAVGAAALLAAAYCLLLSRRLRALTRLDGDVGTAISLLSQQVDALTTALKAASESSGKAGEALERSLVRAETATRNLELMLAASRAASGSAANVAPGPHHMREAAAHVTGDDFQPLSEQRPAPSQDRPATQERPRVLRQRISESLRG